MLPRCKHFLRSSRGLNTVEVVIILAIVVGIALIFKDEIGAFVRSLLDQIFSKDIDLDQVVPSSTP